MTTEELRPVELLSAGHRLERFHSGIDELDRWLRNTAHVAASAGTAATYVLCRNDVVVG